MIYPSPKSPVNRQPMTVGWGRELISAVRSTMPVSSPGMLIRRGIYGTRYLPTAEAGTRTFAARKVKPFDVRWMSHDEDGTDPGKGEWQIYLPFGAMVVNYAGLGRTYTALPTNDDGEQADGEKTYQWYAIKTPEDEHAGLYQEIDGWIYKTWTVYVLTKPWARFLVDTDPEANDDVTWTDAVATIGVAEYNGEDGRVVRHTVVQLTNGAMVKTWDATDPFSLEYKLDDETQKNSGHTVEVVHQTKMLGRLQVDNVEPVVVASAKEVWIKIDHKDEEFKLEVLGKAPHDTKSNDDQTVYKIYDMDGKGVVTHDYRASIPTPPFYTSASSGRQ